MRNIPYIIGCCNSEDENKDCPIDCPFENACLKLYKPFYENTYCFDEYAKAFMDDKILQFWFNTMDNLYSYTEGEI